MTRVKICGITNLEDALCAVNAGADALGFVFFDKSPRNISPLKAQEIVAALPPFISTVGLFVNEAPEKVDQIMRQARLQVIQLHGDETPEDCSRFESWPVIKALRIKNSGSLSALADYRVNALLLDAWSEDQYGGTGISFDWALLRDLSPDVPLILAGGLTPENVVRAITQVQPYAVDVSSGVEKSPGRKDHRLIDRFVRQVKQESWQ